MCPHSYDRILRDREDYLGGFLAFYRVDARDGLSRICPHDCRTMHSPALFLSLALVASAFAADFPPPDALPSSIALPDLLVMRDGSRIATRADWLEKRAPELRALFSHYMYGARPQNPQGVEGKLIREDKAALGGKATLREVLVGCGLDAPVHLLVLIPNKRAEKVACFLGMNFNGNYRLLDDPLVQMPAGWVGGAAPNRAAEAGRGKDKAMWDVEQTLDRGYAVATFFSGDVVPDDKALAEAVLRKFRAGGSEERGAADTAVIMAWAWGFSRMLDYVQMVPEIDAKRIAAVGHSRNGKTALVAAAFDERFALCIPTQAGCGGTAPSRQSAEAAALQPNGRPKAESVAVINKNFPHWFCGNFKAFNEATDKLPFDQHSLIALCAPRPVLLSCAEGDQWANPEGQFAMLHAAAAVYALFGAAPALPAQRPALGELLNERLGYYIRPGAHSMTGADWKVWLDYADKWLR